MKVCIANDDRETVENDQLGSNRTSEYESDLLDLLYQCINVMERSRPFDGVVLDLYVIELGM